MATVKLGEAFIDIRASLDKLDADLAKVRTRVSTSLSTVAKTAQAAGRKLTASITLPVVGLGIAATKAQRDFDMSMTQITSLVGVAADKVQAMRGQVLQLAGSTTRSPAELADALFFITSAGLRGEKAMNALTSAAQAADVGLGETKVIADALTSAMNAYAKSGLTAGDATGILVSAVREGKLEAAGLAGAVGRILPFASKLGVSFDQVAAAFAAMSLTGLKAEEAGTALRGVFSTLLAPVKQAEDALATVNMSFDTLRQTLREKGLIAMLGELNDAFHGNETALTEIFPNIRALLGLFTLTGENADRVNEIFKSLASSGAADLSKAFGITASSSSFKLNAALSSLGVTLTRIGATVLPIAVKVMQQLGRITDGLVASFDALSPRAKTMTTTILAMAAALGPALLAFGFLTTVVRAAVTALLALASTAGLITLGVAAMVAVQGALILILKQIAQGARSVDEVFKGVKDDLKALADLVTGTASDLLEKVFPDGGAGAAGIKSMMDDIKQAIKELGPAAASAGAAMESLVAQRLKKDLADANLELRIARKEFGNLEPDAIRAAAAAGVLSQAFRKVGEGAQSVTEVDTALQSLSDKMKETKRLTDENAEAQQRMNSVTGRLGISFSSAFEDGIVGGKGLREIFTGLLEDVQRTIVRLLIVEPILQSIIKLVKSGGGGGGGGGFDLFGLIGTGISALVGGIGGATAGGSGPQFTGTNIKAQGSFAAGGTVIGGQPAVVGEHGPELFLPGKTGTIVPNDQLGPSISIFQDIKIAGLNNEMRKLVAEMITQSQDQIVARVHAEALSGSTFKDAFR